MAVRGVDDWEALTVIAGELYSFGWSAMRCCRTWESRLERVDMTSLVPTKGYQHLPQYCDQVKPGG